MRILIISNLYSPEPSGVGPYSAGLAAGLAQRGHGVTVICATPSYPHWRRFPGYRALSRSRMMEANVEVHRCPVYIPTTVSGLTRMAHYASFAASALLPAMSTARRSRPEVVMHVAPTMMAAPVALAAAKMARAISWLHVQDFEVEAGFATGQLQRDSLAGRAGLAFERRCIAAFDQTSAISSEMCRKLIKKGCDPGTVYELRNWADLDLVTPQHGSSYREQWGITTPHVALYSGSIAKKQGIGILIDLARALDHRDDVTIVICGNGPERDELEREAADLPRLMIKDLQPIERLGELLNLATVHLLPQRAGAADLVLPSKLTNMLASGRPVVATAAPGTGLAREVNGCGLTVPPGDAAAMARAVQRLLENRMEHHAMSVAARARAEQVWDRERIIDAFEARLQTVAGVPDLSKQLVLPVDGGKSN